MAINGVIQPELLPVDERTRLRKFDGIYDFAFDWYQDVETVYLVDGVREPYTIQKLKRMYEYLNDHGELYFIEVMDCGKYIPVGDVTFWQNDMPIVIGDKRYRRHGTGRKVIGTLIERGKSLGYKSLYVNEIYDFNISSRKCFESLGFRAYEKTDKGSRYILHIG